TLNRAPRSHGRQCVCRHRTNARRGDAHPDRCRLRWVTMVSLRNVLTRAWTRKLLRMRGLLGTAQRLPFAVSEWRCPAPRTHYLTFDQRAPGSSPGALTI